MMTAFLDLPTRDLLERFASNDPTPGGGSASALAGALAASLARMVGALTVGKKNYEAVSDEAAAAAAEAKLLQAMLEGAVADDAASFERVMAAMAMPKATDEEKAVRKAAMQEALKGATDAPLCVAEAAAAVGAIALRMLEIGNKNASTDAAVAALLAAAGVEGALLNAAINLGSIQDESWSSLRRVRADALWASAATLRQGVWPRLNAAGVVVPPDLLLAAR